MAAFSKITLLIIAILLRCLERKRNKNHKMWIRKIFQDRRQRGEFHHLIYYSEYHDEK